MFNTAQRWHGLGVSMIPKKIMTVGGICSGIGGLELGLQRAGMEIAWMVEKNPFRQGELKRHWPGVKIYGDMHDVGKHSLERVDLIAGGIPCQPHSNAGKREGARDERNLWPEYFRIITELNPTWVILENVVGIITTMLDDILDDLESAAYAAQPFDIPAGAFNLPHRRRRIWIIAHADKNNGILHEQCGKREVWGRLNVDRGALSGSWYPADRCEALSRVRRNNDGIPNWMDRLRALGDAVVPCEAEWIGRHIVAVNDV